LSPPAALLYRILRDYQRGKRCCWPGQGRLGREMGRSRRSVQFYLRELVVAGLLKVERQGLTRTNRYYCTSGEAQRAAPQEAQRAAPQEAQRAAPQPAAHIR